MPSGGSRSHAGRKSTWISGRKFEDTATIRVPKEFKKTLLEIAKKLDAGEEFDLVSNSKLIQNEITKLKTKVVELEISNTELAKSLQREQEVLEQKEKSQMHLDSKLKNLQLLLDEVQQQNDRLREKLNDRSSFQSSEVKDFYKLINQFIHSWYKKIATVSPLQVVGETHKMLTELEKLILSKKVSVTLANNSEEILSKEDIKIITNSSSPNFELVTKSQEHAQLDLLNTKIDEKLISLKPLTSTELSRRFNKKDGYVKGLKYSRKDRLEELPNLLKQYDPQGIGWQFSDVDQKYHPVVTPEISAD